MVVCVCVYSIIHTSDTNSCHPVMASFLTVINSKRTLKILLAGATNFNEFNVSLHYHKSNLSCFMTTTWKVALFQPITRTKASFFKVT